MCLLGGVDRFTSPSPRTSTPFPVVLSAKSDRFVLLPVCVPHLQRPLIRDPFCGDLFLQTVRALFVFDFAAYSEHRFGEYPLFGFNFHNLRQTILLVALPGPFYAFRFSRFFPAGLGSVEVGAAQPLSFSSFFPYLLAKLVFSCAATAASTAPRSASGLRPVAFFFFLLDVLAFFAQVVNPPSIFQPTVPSFSPRLSS